MAKVRFNLHAHKPGSKRIRLVFRYDGQKLVYYTGDTISPTCWNAEAMQVRKTGSCPGAAEVNEGLRQLAEKTLAIYMQYRNERRTLTLARFREELDAFWRGRTLPDRGPVELLQFMQQLIDERQATPDQFTPNTVKSYQTALAKLRQYQAETRRRVDFGTIDGDFLAKFSAWMAAKGFGQNYLWMVMAKLKATLSVAVERGYTAKTDFRFRSFSVKRHDGEHIYLHDAEVARLAALDLSADPTLDRARDLFLIGCYTGLRYSDFSALSPGSFLERDGVLLWSVMMQKTQRRVYGPVTGALLSILAKRGGEPPKAYQNQPLNRYLKELGQMAGFTDLVSVVRFSGGLRVETMVPKWQLLTSHTARRSFATNEYLRCAREGLSYRPIMAITGHTTERQFFKYVRVAGEEHAVLFAKQRAG